MSQDCSGDSANRAASPSAASSSSVLDREESISPSNANNANLEDIHRPADIWERLTCVVSVVTLMALIFWLVSFLGYSVLTDSSSIDPSKQDGIPFTAY
jgi:beta-lactamase regulating signal transducer with metallopeptidase domain